MIWSTLMPSSVVQEADEQEQNQLKSAPHRCQLPAAVRNRTRNMCRLSHKYRCRDTARWRSKIRQKQPAPHLRRENHEYLPATVAHCQSRQSSEQGQPPPCCSSPAPVRHSGDKPRRSNVPARKYKRSADMAVGRTAMWHVSVSLLPQERTPHIAGRSRKAALKLHCSWRREMSCMRLQCRIAMRLQCRIARQLPPLRENSEPAPTPLSTRAASPGMLIETVQVG